MDKTPRLITPMTMGAVFMTITESHGFNPSYAMSYG